MFNRIKKTIAVFKKSDDKLMGTGVQYSELTAKSNPQMILNEYKKIINDNKTKIKQLSQQRKVLEFDVSGTNTRDVYKFDVHHELIGEGFGLHYSHKYAGKFEIQASFDAFKGWLDPEVLMKAMVHNKKLDYDIEQLHEENKLLKIESTEFVKKYM